MAYPQPGFQTKEVEPWSEEGQTWRRLEVTFPDSVRSHSKHQTFYFDEVGLLRRNDYTNDLVAQGSRAFSYMSDHRAFDNLIYPTKRRIYRAGDDNLPIRDRVSIAIDYHRLEFG